MIGRSVADTSHGPKIGGVFPFLNDSTIPGALHAAVVRSPLPHGRVLSVGVNALLQLPGVLAVFTADEIPGETFCPATIIPEDAVQLPADKRLLTSNPRHVGDGIAVVVADSRLHAARAARTADIQIQPLPAILTMDDAIREGSILCKIDSRIAEVDNAIANSGLIVEHAIRLGAVRHFCLETHACAALPGPKEGDITVWTNTQSPHELRCMICSVLCLSEKQVHIRKFSEGGGFGAKQEMYEEALAAWLALRVGRPIRFSYTRDEESVAGRLRQETDLHLCAGFSKTGVLLASKLTVKVNAGAYSSHTPYVLSCIGGYLPSVYPNALHEFHGTAFYSHQTPAGAYRGYGIPEAATITEIVLEKAAKAIGVGSVDIRSLNVGAGANGKRLRHLLGCLSASSRECADSLSCDDSNYHGTGYSIALKSSAGTPGRDTASAAIRITRIGQIDVITGTNDSGTGSNTGLIQIAATELGVDDPGRFNVIEANDALVPADLGSAAQRSIFVGGRAVAAASRAARTRLVNLAAMALEMSPDEIRLNWSQFMATGPGKRQLDLGQLIGDLAGSELVEYATVSPTDPGISAVAVCVDVCVDPRTMRLRVPACRIALDCGTVVNPRSARGQVTGAVVQGIGLALTDTAMQSQASIMAHGIPRSVDAPDRCVIIFANSLGRPPSGIGELVIAAVPGAVAGAFYAAVNVAVAKMPIRPDVLPLCKIADLR
jgi:xanthine dehydrogenase molybdenum-binding subunit